MVKTREFTFMLPSLSLTMKIVADVEELVTDPEDDDQIPYWAEIWPASQGLARYIWEQVDLSGSTLLELGSGLGLTGLVAACKGATVTLTDYQPEALRFITDNAARNGISGVTVALADWREFPLTECFDWIIGADISYNPQVVPFLGPILANNLAPGGQVLFSHPSRQVSYDFIEEQRRVLGLQERHLLLPVHIDDPYFPDYQIDIHHLYRENR